MEKKVIYISPSIEKNCAPGMRAHFFIESMIENGIEPIIFSNSEIQTFSKKIFIKKSKYLSNNNSKSLLKRLFEEFYFAISIIFFLLRIKKNIPVIYSLPPFFSLLVVFPFISKKRKFILDIRDLYPEALSALDFLNKKNILYRIIDRYFQYILKKSDLVICATQGISNYISDNYKKPSEVVFNGFPNEILKYPKNKFEDFTIIFHGILGNFQNIELLVNVINELTDYKIKFIVIGFGKKSHLFKKINNKNFSFLGKKSNKDTLEIVSRCHLGISLRLDDQLSKHSIPVKVFEYLGLNLNSIITPKSEGSELIEHLGCGLGLDNDQESIKDCILNYYNKFLSGNYTIKNPKIDCYSRENQSLNFTNFIIKII